MKQDRKFLRRRIAFVALACLLLCALNVTVYEKGVQEAWQAGYAEARQDFMLTAQNDGPYEILDVDVVAGTLTCVNTVTGTTKTLPFGGAYIFVYGSPYGNAYEYVSATVFKESYVEGFRNAFPDSPMVAYIEMSTYHRGDYDPLGTVLCIYLC